MGMGQLHTWQKTVKFMLEIALSEQTQPFIMVGCSG